jgi:hypothetical protein
MTAMLLRDADSALPFSREVHRWDYGSGLACHSAVLDTPKSARTIARIAAVSGQRRRYFDHCRKVGIA